MLRCVVGWAGYRTAFAYSPHFAERQSSTGARLYFALDFFASPVQTAELQLRKSGARDVWCFRSTVGVRFHRIRCPSAQETFKRQTPCYLTLLLDFLCFLDSVQFTIARHTPTWHLKSLCHLRGSNPHFLPFIRLLGIRGGFLPLEEGNRLSE